MMTKYFAVNLATRHVVLFVTAFLPVSHYAMTENCQHTSEGALARAEGKDAETLARVLLEGNAENLAKVDSFYCTYQVFRETRPGGFRFSGDRGADQKDAACEGVWFFAIEQEFLQLDSLKAQQQLQENRSGADFECTSEFWTRTYLRHGELEGNYQPDELTLNLFREKAKHSRRPVVNPLAMWSTGEGTLFPKARNLERLLEGNSGPIQVSTLSVDLEMPLDLEGVEVKIERNGMRVCYGFDVNAGFFLRWHRLEYDGGFVETFVNELKLTDHGYWFPMEVSRISGTRESDTLVVDRIIVTDFSPEVDWSLAKTELEAGTYFFEPVPGRTQNYRVIVTPELIGPADLQELLKRTGIPKIKASTLENGGATLSWVHWSAIGILNLSLLTILVFTWHKMMANPLFSSRKTSQS